MGMVQGVQQLNLFEDTPEKVNMYLAMDKIRNKYHPKAIGRAAGLLS